MIWKEQEVRLSDLNPADYNPRSLTDKEKKQIKKSLERFGLAIPIIINTDNTIIGGHQRFEIEKERGAETINVLLPERKLSKREEQELNVKLNKLGGQFDIEKLKDLGLGFNEFLDIGFEPVEIDTADDEVQNLYNFTGLKTIQIQIKEDKYLEILEKLGDESIEEHLEKILL